MNSFLNYLKNHLAYFGVAALLLLTVGTAKAQILLTINDSNSSDVTVTATLAGPSQDATGNFGNGIDLLNFFTGLSTGGDFATGTPSLTTGNGTGSLTLNAWDVDQYQSDGTDEYVDLNLYNGHAMGNMTFTSGVTAFTGTVTLDLGSNALPTDGSEGDIVLGYTDAGPNTPIGKWEVINNPVSAPEPAAWMLMCAGLVVVAVLRSRMAISTRLDEIE